MASTAAQLLDELMGKDRNLVPGEKSTQVHWSHYDVCKHFLCGFCPSDLFVNTKADLGACPKVHDDALRKSYEASSEYADHGYEEDFVSYLSGIQGDVDRKIRRGHERLLINKEREQELAATENEKVKMLTERMDKMLEEIEVLGSEGKVEEAQGIARLVEQLKEERDMEIKVHTNQVPLILVTNNKQQTVPGQEKQMEVCEVCGAFLIVGDAQSRVDDHLQGKQHVGYAQIKSKLDELKDRPWIQKKREMRGLPPKSEENDSLINGEKRERRSSRERSSRNESKRDESRRDRERSRRSRSKEKDRRSSRRSSRERSRSDRERKRSRDRDSRRRSHRSRSRERKRSRERSRRSRSRDSSRRNGDRREDRKDDRKEKSDERRDEKPKEEKPVEMQDDANYDGEKVENLHEGEQNHQTTDEIEAM